MYPRGSPKFNLMQANAIARKALLGTKKPSPKTKRASPRGTCVGGKSRAQWNPGLEKGLVELLHEHNTPYHRGQNGWGSETWNLMTKIFHTRYGHTNFTKHQIQEKEKELKRDYRILKEARKQSGAGWNMHTCMIEADPHLWDNLITSWPKISKFKTKTFPLFDLLGELYDGHIAEGTYNFTSVAQPSQQPEVTQVESDGDLEAEREEEEEVDLQETDLQMFDDQVDVAQRSAGVENEQISQRGAVVGSKKKPQKEAKKPKKSEDAMVGVMEKYIEMKKKQAEDEAALLAKESARSRNVQDFSISRCIAVLHKIEGITRDERVRAYKVFKNGENREIFLTSAAEDEETAVLWLRSEMAELPRGT